MVCNSINDDFSRDCTAADGACYGQAQVSAGRCRADDDPVFGDLAPDDRGSRGCRPQGQLAIGAAYGG